MISALEASSGNRVATPLQGRALARVAGRAGVCFSVPLEDTDEFQHLGTTECRRVRRLLAVFREIHERWEHVRSACAFHGRKLMVDGVTGWSPSRIKNTYYEFVKGGKKAGRSVVFEAGDWRMLARWQRQGHAGLSGRAAFLRLWLMLCDNHQRSSAGAFRDLVSLYTTGFTTTGQKVKCVVWGESFPGYEGWPPAVAHTGLPEGWTKSNLAKHAPDRFERTAARVGIKKASGEGLKARFSRVGLLPYQILSGDDEVQDVKCLVPGQTELVRPRGLGLHDAATDGFVGYVMKSTWWDAEAQKQRVLNERDTMWFVLGYLMDTGFRADTGTLVLVERGAFAVRGDSCQPERPISDPDRTDLRARLWRVTDGKVTFENSQGFAKAAHGGQFAPPVGGNPRFKPIEGAWNRLRNRLDGLPGQAGKDRDHAPEASGREAENAVQLLKRIGLLPIEQGEALALPLLTFRELAQQVYQAVADLNNDPAHAIGEWEKCGYILKEYFDAAVQQWLPLAELLARVGTLDGAQAQALAESLKDNPSYLRARRMTRAEALATGKAALQRVPQSALLELAGRENAMNQGELKAVRAGEFTFDVREIDPDPVAYFARDAEGKPLREGDRYLCLVNPLFPDTCVIYDADERFVSVCPRHVPAPRADTSAVLREAGGTARWRDSKLAPMRERHGEDAARLEFIHAHNAAVLAGAKPVTSEDKARAREVASNVRRFGAAAGDEILAAGEPAFDAGGTSDAEGAASELLAAL